MKELLSNRILTGLPSEDFARLLPHLEPFSLSRGDDLYEPGTKIHYVYFPESAVVSHLYVLAEGVTTEADMIGRDGAVGLTAIFNSPPPEHWTQATIGGSALRADVGVVRREFMRGGELHRLLLTYVSERMAQLSQRAVCNGRHSIEERMSNWLLMIHDRVEGDELALTHEQIAGHLGTRRAGVTEAANALRETGGLSYGRGLIRIRDRQALESAACECYRVLNRAIMTAVARTVLP